MADTKALATNDVKVGGKLTPDTLGQVQSLVDKANNGDRQALAELVKTFGSNTDLWRQSGNMAAQTRESWLRLTFGDQLFSQEAERRRLAKMRADLCGADPTPLERLLVERILACYLAVNYADAMYCQKAAELSIEWLDYYQRRITRAQKRYLDAILALAKVRRLQLPSVQVNIGGQQVNLSVPTPH